MKTHELKCWPEFFLPVQAWKKVFEIRHNDRGFEVGDILWLREWDPTTATITAGNPFGEQYRTLPTSRMGLKTATFAWDSRPRTPPAMFTDLKLT